MKFSQTQARHDLDVILLLKCLFESPRFATSNYFRTKPCMVHVEAFTEGCYQHLQIERKSTVSFQESQWEIIDSNFIGLYGKYF